MSFCSAHGAFIRINTVSKSWSGCFLVSHISLRTRFLHYQFECNRSKLDKSDLVRLAVCHIHLDRDRSEIEQTSSRLCGPSVQQNIGWAATWQNQQNVCAPSEDSDQPGHPPSLLSLRCPHEQRLGPYLPIERTAKTLIRLGGCPGWSESSQGAHATLLVFSCRGSGWCHVCYW